MGEMGGQIEFINDLRFAVVIERDAKYLSSLQHRSFGGKIGYRHSMPHPVMIHFCQSNRGAIVSPRTSNLHL